MREEATLRLPVTVDKSHIITLGERLYAESIELVRELVNNAYDADATRVNVQITKDKIVVEDNGNGMDLAPLSHPDNPHLAYQRQSKLMRDAFGKEEF